MTNYVAFYNFCQIDDVNTPDELFSRFRNTLSTEDKNMLNGTQKLWDQIKLNFS
jgi:hypothetical protein